MEQRSIRSKVQLQELADWLMNMKLAQGLKVPSLFLAAALQVLPMVRVALPVTETAANVLAIVFRWMTGTAAALGGVQAVSGASTVITNPLSTNIVQGVPFALRLTTGPELAHYWTASPLPPGLSLSGVNGSSLWKIMGNPTTPGTTSISLTAQDTANSNPNRIVSATLVINVASNVSPPAITLQPVGQTVSQGQNATLSVAATGAPPLDYQWRFNDVEMSGQTGFALALNPATTNDAGNYDVVVSNNFGSVTSLVATLTVNPPPLLPPTVTGQPANQTVTQGQNAAFFVTATGTSPFSYYWKKGKILVAGPVGALFTITNTQTTDAGSYSVIVSNSVGIAASLPATLTVDAVLQAPFIVTAPTSQTVFDGARVSLEVVAGGTAPFHYQWYFNAVAMAGKTVASLTLAAVQPANAGAYSVVVSNQIGFVASTAAQLSVIPARGTYSGLYFDTNSISIQSSGPFTATVTDGGKYSAALTLLGKKYSMSGQFDSSGFATNIVLRGSLNSLAVGLQLDLSGGDQISGQITDGSWLAQLLADRVTFNKTTNAAPQAGIYTLVIPGTPGTNQTPAGNGFGTVKIDLAGRLTFMGTVADGAKVTQRTTISKFGTWPLYGTLYGSGGTILGWMTFTNRPADDINGLLTWTKLPQPSTRYYPAGFVFQPEAMGSKFLPSPAGTPTLNVSNGVVLLTDGNLAQSITNPVLSGANGKISNAGGTRVILSIAPSSGLLTGSVTDPATGKSIGVKGAVLQKQDLGYGFFLGTSPVAEMSQSGWFYFGP